MRGIVQTQQRRILVSTKGETNFAELEHDQIRKDPKKCRRRFTPDALPPPFLAKT
jgi:hypothetical protein